MFTQRSKALMLVITILLALVVQTPAQAQERVVRQVTVVGEGEVVARPDTAYVHIGVETQAPTAQAALTENNNQTAAIIEQITALGVARNDIQTSSFSIYPRYDRNARQVTGYVVTNMLRVTIRNLEQAGVLLDQVVQLGANRVYGVYFSVDDPTAVLDEARGEAMADARRKAEQLALLAGAQLGPVLEITENIGAMPRIPVIDAPVEAAPAPDAAVPIEPGEQRFSVRLQVTFELR
jgi:hypothetical protein